MLKSLVITLASLSIAATALAELAQANRRTCAMPITKGGCPMLVYLPEPPRPRGK